VSAGDIEADWLNEHGVPFIQYPFSIDGTEYRDDCRPETKQFIYQKMRSGSAVNTAAISPMEYTQFFEQLMETGKNVIYTDMSRALSSSIQNVEVVAEEIREKYPNQKFYFLDSFCATGGLKLFLKQLVKRKEEGMSFEDVIAWGEEHKLEYIHRFMVDDLQWLRRGGRLSNGAAFAGTLLAIKPQIYVANDGKLVAFEKVHGRKKCIKKLVESMEKDLADYSADDREDCEKVIGMIKETYPQLSNAEFTITDLGPTICAHVGPDFLAIIYHGTKRVM